MKFEMRKIVLLVLIIIQIPAAKAGMLKGRIMDGATKEALPGATVMVYGTTKGVAADNDGVYEMELEPGEYVFVANYIGYKDLVTGSIKIDNQTLTLDFLMEADGIVLGAGGVTAIARKDNEIAQVQAQKKSYIVQTGVSAQQIARTQDKDASEVIKRVPGISIIDERYVMVRGLSQRYNNVWMNGSAVPSSEPDTRAFSFDIIPSSQLDNMVIVKSPAPEYPADFSGGFILVNTKDMPSGESLDIRAGAGVNDRTHFRPFMKYSGSGLDWIGFGSGYRMIDAGMKGKMVTYNGFGSGNTARIDMKGNGFRNDWTLHKRTPVADPKLNISYSRKWDMEKGGQLGLLSAANYSNSYKTCLDMENSLYGPYNTVRNEPVYFRKAVDNQYTNEVRLGALMNWSYRPADDRHMFEWKNIFNQLSRDRYTERTGINAQPDNINNMEYYYSSRMTLNTQFTGKHDFSSSSYLDWSAGYAFAVRALPDRRLIERNDRTNNRMGIYRIRREFTRLAEHIASASLNYRKDFDFSNFHPTLKTGFYSEYRTRAYTAREFQVGWDPTNTLPSGFEFDPDVQDNVLVETNYGPDRLYLQEEVNWMNNYDGRNTAVAGYFGVNLPWKRLDIYAGLRYEFCRQELIMNVMQHQESKRSTYYDYNDLFPSMNAVYRFNDRHQMRLAYGKSVNRPEFRELSTSVFYDFDLGSSVMGNAELKAAYVHNADIRYEFYPDKGEQISVALFYKHFRNPIEWAYTMSGGTDPIYSYINARGANSYGIEVDIRKDLGFIGLKNFSWSFNGTLIKSRVTFPDGTNNLDRPMQGQSPYLVNTGFFYNNSGKGWGAALLYNRIGKRIIGVGSYYGTSSEGEKTIPDSYEMPRNAIDISLSKQIRKLEIKLGVRDVLAEKVNFKQFETVEINGAERKIEEVTRSYKPGRTYSISIGYSF